MLATDLVRLALGVGVLAFASWTDWNWRRAPNVLWRVVTVAGLVLLAVDLAAEPSRLARQWPYLVAAPLVAGFFWTAWRLRLIAGGADAKALMSFAVLLPFPLDLGALPVVPSVFPGSVAVLADSMLAFLLVPLGFAAWNVAHGSFRFPHLLLGRSVPVADVGVGHDWPMERVEDGRVRTTWFAHRRADDPEALRAALAAAGRSRTWVTPKVPFMLPLLAGFVAAFVVGDVLTWAIARVLGA